MLSTQKNVINPKKYYFSSTQNQVFKTVTKFKKIDNSYYYISLCHFVSVTLKQYEEKFTSLYKNMKCAP